MEASRPTWTPAQVSREWTYKTRNTHKHKGNAIQFSVASVLGTAHLLNAPLQAAHFLIVRLNLHRSSSAGLVVNQLCRSDGTKTAHRRTLLEIVQIACTLRQPRFKAQTISQAFCGQSTPRANRVASLTPSTLWLWGKTRVRKANG